MTGCITAVDIHEHQAGAGSYDGVSRAFSAAVRVTKENAALKQDLKDTQAALATERERNPALVRMAAELSLELEQARAELESAQHVPRLPGARSPRLPPRRRR